VGSLPSTSADVATDAIARALAQGMSRREALRKGGLAFAATMAMSPADAFARLRGHCPKHHVKCGKKCCPKGEICIHPKHKHKHGKHAKPHCACPAGTKRQHGKCVSTAKCINGQTTCSGTCVSLTHDPKNCGACGHACAAGLVCANSKCVSSCPAPTTNCSGGCVNLDTDPFNCGKCGGSCGAGKECGAGVCVNPCPSGTTTCNGGCVDLRNDPQNCGACGKVCATGTVCANGVCAASCASGQTLCNGICVNLANSAKNCGTCGHVCASGQVCTPSGTTPPGMCASSCGGSGTVVCAGSCCPGTACCGPDCQTQHTIGATAQNYYDCNPLATPGDAATYSANLAKEAAKAINSSATPSQTTCPGGSVVSIPTGNGGYAVLQYTGSLAGYMAYNNTQFPNPGCPNSSSPTWT
jgi:Stigma-specific protein, Stig1